MRKILELCLVLSVVGVICVSAEPQDESGYDYIPVYEMEEITVTATRVPVPVSRAPVATEIYTSQEIDESGVSTVGELLKNGSGFEVRDQGYTGSVSTLSIRGSTANQVLLLVDGRPANSISLGMADISEISLDDVSRVEVVRGPMSSLYGANALGGVVNVVTGPRTEEPSVDGRAEFGSHGREMYAGSGSSSWDGLGFSLTANGRREDGDRENSDHRSTRASAKVTYSESDLFEADLTGALEAFEVGLPGPVPQEGLSPTYGSSEVTSLFDRQKNFKGYVDLTVDSRLNDRVEGGLKLYYDRRVMEVHSVYEGFDMSSFTPYKAVEDDEYVTENAGTNIQVEALLRSNMRLVFGVDAALYSLDAEQVVLNDSTGEFYETRWSPADTTAGFYVEADWNPWDRLGLIGGGRFDWSQAYGSRVSPSVGLVYNLYPGARVKLSVGRAFRAPTLNDLYWPESSFVGGNISLAPEDGLGGELRAEFEPAKSVGLRLSVFAREVEDLIEWSPDEDWVWRPANLNEFRSRGAELEVEYSPARYASVNGHISYLSATQVAQEVVAYDEYLTPLYGMVERRAAFRPRTEGAISAAWKAPYGFDLKLGLDYAGRRVSYWQQVDTTGGSWNPATREKWLEERVLTSATVGLELGPQYLFFKVDNIFDSEYREQFGFGLLDRDYPGPRRTYSYGLKVTLE